MGVISAAEEQGVYSFGFDQPQNHLAPDTVLTSMIKKLDTVVYNESQSLLLDTFSIDTKVYSLENNGVGIYRPQAEKMLNKVILDAVDNYKNKIINGEITVPTIPNS